VGIFFRQDADAGLLSSLNPDQVECGYSISTILLFKPLNATQTRLRGGRASAIPSEVVSEAASGMSGRFL
jgi:hypothetical protein